MAYVPILFSWVNPSFQAVLDADPGESESYAVRDLAI